MNKLEFITEVMDLYPDTFKPEREEHFKGWFKLYNKVLGENWDYDKLYSIFSRDYKSVVTPPHPSWFAEYRKDVIIEQPKISKSIPELTGEQKKENIRKWEEIKKKARETLKIIK